MKQPVFIRLENTLEEAMYYRNSPEMNIYSFNGVQLLPSSEYPYTQVAKVELEDFSVQAFDMCGNFLDNIDSQIFVVTPFQNPKTGENNIYWSFMPDGQQDFGKRLIYLRFLQGSNDYIYSSPFYLTNEDAEYTSRWDYWDELNDTVLSTQLNIYYIQPFIQLALSEYTSVYIGGYKSIVSGATNYERWRFGIVFIDLLIMFSEMQKNEYVYCDLKRCSLFKTFEIPQLQGLENFAELDIDMYMDNDDTYDPNYVEPVPPVPTPTYAINLIEVVYGDLANTVKFKQFNSDIPNPAQFSYEYSVDGATWSSQLSYTTPIVTIPVPNPMGINYYYRIRHIETGTISNVVQIVKLSLTLQYVTSVDTAFKATGNTYKVGYQANGFSFPAGENIRVEYSYDNGVNYVPSFYQIQTPTTQGEVTLTVRPPLEATKWRIKYPKLGLTSNIVTHEF